MAWRDRRKGTPEVSISLSEEAVWISTTFSHKLASKQSASSCPEGSPRCPSLVFKMAHRGKKGVGLSQMQGSGAAEVVFTSAVKRERVSRISSTTEAP